MSNYSKFTVVELRRQCKEKGIKRYSRLRKAELIDLIQRHDDERDRGQIRNIYPFKQEVFEEPKVKTETLPIQVKRQNIAFKSRLETWRFTTNYKPQDPLEQYVTATSKAILNRLQISLSKHSSLKANLWLSCTYKKGEETQDFYFNTENQEIHRSTDLKEALTNMKQTLRTRMDEFQARGSGWALININFVQLAIVKYAPYRGSSYIELPDQIKN